MSDPTTPTPALLKIGDVARLLGCSTRTVHRLRDCGDLPPELRIGGMLRWRAADVEQWLTAGCPKRRASKGGAR